MVRAARRLLAVALLAGGLALPQARAQAPAAPRAATPAATAPRPAPPPAGPAPGLSYADAVDDLPPALPAAPVPPPEGDWQPSLLRTLPRPLDEPRSLFQAPPAPTGPAINLEGPYFQRDPILDPPQWHNEPGWFTNLQIDLIKPHVNNEMNNAVTTRGGQMANIALGNAPLGWTVAPRIEFGYRLPSGWGELSIADRFFNSQGTDTVGIAPNGPTLRTSKINVNYTDFDYGSREYTPWANWNMRWVAGARILETFVSTTAEESFRRAAAGTGIFAGRQINSTTGAGPHYRVDLERRFGSSGFSFVSKLDFAWTFGRQRQEFDAYGTAVTPGGPPNVGRVAGTLWQQIPILNVQAGLGYQPPSRPYVRCFLGYVNESFWYVMNNSNTDTNHTGTRGNFYDQGVVFRIGINY